MGAAVGQKGAFNDINMTPLIDIVLVVLIIMMVNIPIQIEEMSLKLPSPNPPPQPVSEEHPDQLVIAMYEDGRVALNRAVSSEQNMLYEMTRRLRSMGKKDVFIDAASTIPYGKVVDMVDLARNAGAANVGLAKMKPEGPLPPTSVTEGSGMPRGIFIGSPLVRGEMTEKRADDAIQPLKAALTQCFLTSLSGHPGLTGSHTVYLEVGPNGEIGSETVTYLKAPYVEKDEVGDAALKDCVEQTMKAIKFPELGEGNTAWVRYPLLYSPG
ncbi:MAG: biopolymer transporter ExbD [Alphaproteobacteria bacterium]|nr:biopolymer transporter ExbD [Alphaproteobacteria bacterium]MCB9697178.1 biopolymer transporter ExbD [Alphaproteobacteria bacterium]